MREKIKEQTRELREVFDDFNALHEQINSVGKTLSKAFRSGARAYTIGNGGSSLQAQHLAEELSGKYRAKRDPVPCMALSADSSVITCIGNDFGFENIFSRQIDAFGKPGDILIAFSTSGNSKNILNAVDSAHKKNMTVIALTTEGDGLLRKRADLAVKTPLRKGKPLPTERIQELHLHAIHLICEYLENI